MPADKQRTYDIYLQIIQGRLHPLAGAVEFIEKCHRLDLKCALATSADRVKMEGNLKEIGIPADRFAAIVTGSEIERKKPDPQAFEVAAKKLGLSNAQCIVVEDAVNGVRAGKAAGSRVLGIMTTFDDATLRAAGADWTAANLAHVPDDVLQTG
jgi:HAD superfamily hydrolase (TIGR01509 family)